MKKTLRLLLVVALVAFTFTAACRKDEEPAAEASGSEAPSGPDRVAVQHILIAFQGSINKEGVTRTQDEAQKLAQEILTRAKGGEDFDALVKQYTDDQYPGIYRMTNTGIEADRAVEYPRGGMVKAFGDVSFGLEVGGIGMTVFDPAESKYGWHIIKRLE
jgi:hypothetical protein